METIRTLVEGQTRVSEVVKTLIEAKNPEPSYKGSTPLSLAVYSSNASAWNGIIKLQDRNVRIYRGRFGVQKHVPGLIIPFDIGHGEWEWDGVGKEPSKRSIV